VERGPYRLMRIRSTQPSCSWDSAPRRVRTTRLLDRHAAAVLGFWLKLRQEERLLTRHFRLTTRLYEAGEGPCALRVRVGPLSPRAGDARGDVGRRDATGLQAPEPPCANASTLWRMARVCSGVLPQQDPMMATPASSASERPAPCLRGVACRPPSRPREPADRVRLHHDGQLAVRPVDACTRAAATMSIRFAVEATMSLSLLANSAACSGETPIIVLKVSPSRQRS